MPQRNQQLESHILVASVLSLMAIGCIGVIESFLGRDAHIMNMVPMELMVVCPIVAVGVFARISGYVKLAYAVSILLVLWIVLAVIDPFDMVPNHWHSLPPLLSILILSTVATALVLPQQGKLTFYFFRILSLISFLGAILLQSMLWFGDIDFVDQRFFDNPNALSLAAFAVLVLAFMSALLASGNRTNIKSLFSRPELLFSVAGLAVGFTLFSSLTANDIATVESKALTRIQTLENTLQTRLRAQVDALERLVDRVAIGEVDASKSQLLQLDMENYSRDFPTLDGIMVLDKNLNIIAASDYALQFHSSPAFQAENVQKWLTQQFDSVASATLGSTLSGPKPTVLKVFPITPANQPSAQMVALLDLPNLVALDEDITTSNIASFWQIDDETLFRLDAPEGERLLTYDKFKRQFPHYMSRQIEGMDGNYVSIITVLTNYRSMSIDASLNQLVLFTCLAFVFSLAISHERSAQLKREREKLVYQAQHDSITGLFNRWYFDSRANQRLFSDHQSIAALFVNLDGFRHLNDSFGTHLGNQVLRLVAQRLRCCVKEESVLGRYAGDEYVALFPCKSITEAQRYAERLVTEIRKALVIDDAEIVISASIGYSFDTFAQVQSTKKIIKQAEMAMAEAKRRGGNFCYPFAPEMEMEYTEQLTIRAALQKALKEQLLEVHYQPIVNVDKGCVTGAESLVRWQHEGKNIPPSIFIPIAEHSGQIINLGEQVLQQVLKDCNSEPLLQTIHLSVNVSVHQLNRYDFAKVLQDLLANSQVSSSNLLLELTEGVFAGNDKEVSKALFAKLQTMGCGIAIDDFGTGYSSLAYLDTIPAQVVKLDRTFVADCEPGSDHYRLVEGVITICHRLNKKIVIEGIETEQQYRMFKDLGVSLMQGYYFGKPMPLKAFIEHMRNLKLD